MLGWRPAAPVGIRWQKAKVAGIGAVELPAGETWKRTDGPPLEVEDPDAGITIMLQHQPDMSAEERDGYVESFIEVNKRDAPKYKVTGKKIGSLPGGPGARVDGEFNNGTAFSTRDYLVFSKGGVTVISGVNQWGQDPPNDT
jgi:hypothetical protein